MILTNITEIFILTIFENKKKGIRSLLIDLLFFLKKDFKRIWHEKTDYLDLKVLRVLIIVKSLKNKD